MWYEHWFDDSLSDKIETLIGQGFVKLINGRLDIVEREIVNSPWLHVAGSTDCRKCNFWNRIMFKGLGVMHSFCRYHCWKVVTRPRTLKELIQCHNLMYVVPYEYNFINPLPGKAGLDKREYTSEPYGMFNYATSLLDGLRLRDVMIHMVAKYIPDREINGKLLKHSIMLKRSCTEMERAYPGNDSFWTEPQTREEWEVERRLEEIFNGQADMTFQSAWVKDKILQNWMTYANSIGDKSVVEFVGADIFNVQSRSYGSGDLETKQKGGDPERAEVSEEPKKKTEKKKRSKVKEKK